MRAAQAVMVDLAASGLSAEQLALVMELSAAVATEARPVVDGTAQRRRRKDREYQAERRRQNRPISADDADFTPPKEEISTPPVSEANASGGEPPADPMKELFDVGVTILTGSGKTESQARSLVGKWRKEQGEAKVLAAFLECRGKTISNPVEWLQRRLKTAKWVSKSGYEYRGDDEAVMREAEKRNDMDVFWRVKASLKQAA